VLAGHATLQAHEEAYNDDQDAAEERAELADLKTSSL
jgi:hypothetical protein